MKDRNLFAKISLLLIALVFTVGAGDVSKQPANIQLKTQAMNTLATTLNHIKIELELEQSEPRANILQAKITEYRKALRVYTAHGGDATRYSEDEEIVLKAETYVYNNPIIKNNPATKVDLLEKEYFAQVTALLNILNGGKCPYENPDDCGASLGFLVKNETIKFISEFLKIEGKTKYDLRGRVRNSIKHAICQSEFLATKYGIFRQPRQMDGDKNFMDECSKPIQVVKNYKDVLTILFQYYELSEIEYVIKNFGYLTFDNSQIFSPYSDPRVIFPKSQYTVGEKVEFSVRFFSEDIIKYTLDRKKIELPEGIKKEDLPDSTQLYYTVPRDPIYSIDIQQGDVEFYVTLVNKAGEIIKLKTARFGATNEGPPVKATDELGRELVNYRGDPRYGREYDAVFRLDAKHVGQWTVSDISMMYVPVQKFVFHADRFKFIVDENSDSLTVIPDIQFSQSDFQEFQQQEISDVAKESTRTTYLKFTESDEMSIRVTISGGEVNEETGDIIREPRVYLSRCRKKRSLSQECMPIYRRKHANGYSMAEIMSIANQMDLLITEYTSWRKAPMRWGEGTINFMNNHLGFYLKSVTIIGAGFMSEILMWKFIQRYFGTTMIKRQMYESIINGGDFAGKSYSGRLPGYWKILKILAYVGVGSYAAKELLSVIKEKYEYKLGGAEAAVFTLRDLLDNHEEKAAYDKFLSIHPNALDTYLKMMREALHEYDLNLEREKKILEHECLTGKRQFDQRCFAIPELPNGGTA